MIDGDTFEAGNLVRHVLGMPSVGASKAAALAAHLNLASPHARVTALGIRLPLVSAKLKELLEPFDLIIDSTANDEVLLALARVAFDGAKSFVSASVGWAAQRLFCFQARATSFPSEEYWRDVGPWLEMERAQETPAQTRWAGAGCWHPVFPAQAVDLSLMAAAAVKEIEHGASTRDGDGLHVFERASAGDGFLGLTRLARNKS